MGYKALNRIEVMRNKKKVIVPAGEQFDFNEKEVADLKKAGAIEEVKSEGSTNDSKPSGGKTSGGKASGGKTSGGKASGGKTSGGKSTGDQNDDGDDLGLGDDQK